jgi:hypothetical protein
VSKEWKTITAPKMLYLPVVARDGSFDNSGQRVETTDELEILPGTGKIRINGIEHMLMRSIDDLIDENGVITLSKPARAVRISSRGAGWAVGRMGEAQSHARGTEWDQKAAADWEGDAGTDALPFDFQHPEDAPDYAKKAAGATHARGFPIIPEDQPRQISFTTPERQGFGIPKPMSHRDQQVVDEFFDEFEQHMSVPNTEMREVTLADGSTAHALFSTVTGKQIGTPTRKYQVRRDAEGRQLASPTGTHGPKSKFDMDEYRRRVKAQAVDARPAPTARERYDAEEKRQAQQQRQAQQRQAQARLQPKPQPAPMADPALHETLVPIEPLMAATTTGIEHLDALIGGKYKQCQGYPLGRITHLYGPGHVTEALIKGAPTAKSIAEAFGRIHLIAAQGQNRVLVQLEAETPSDALRLSLAEELPVLENMLKKEKVAVVVITPDWGDAVPALLRFVPTLRLQMTPHERDDRFITALVTKTMVSEASNQTASFPKPA